MQSIRYRVVPFVPIGHKWNDVCSLLVGKKQKATRDIAGNSRRMILFVYLIRTTNCSMHLPHSSHLQPHIQANFQKNAIPCSNNTFRLLIERLTHR